MSNHQQTEAQSNLPWLFFAGNHICQMTSLVLQNILKARLQAMIDADICLHDTSCGFVVLFHTCEKVLGVLTCFKIMNKESKDIITTMIQRGKKSQHLCRDCSLSWAWASSIALPTNN